MNIGIALLLAYLLCAEAPNGTLEERWLIAQTVVYRLEARGPTIEQVIYAPKQYQGVGLIDADAYRRLRRQELEENFAIALAAILMGPVARVSNFAEPNSADWQSRCELKYIAGKHHFYLCPDWGTQMAKTKRKVKRFRCGMVVTFLASKSGAPGPQFPGRYYGARKRRRPAHHTPVRSTGHVAAKVLQDASEG